MQHGKRIALAMGVLICAVSFVFLSGIGQTQARYENVRSWKGIYAPENPVIKSNFLARDGQTVLLKDWDISVSSYREVGIRLMTDEGAVSGTLRCQSDSELITATVDEESLTVNKTENYAALELTAAAKEAELTEETLVTVHVSWMQDGEETAWADFVVKLLPPTKNQAEQVTVEEAQRSDATLNIICPEAFACEEVLPIKLTLPQEADSVVLSYDGQGFPKNTRYVTNEEGSFVLADEMMITIPAGDRNEVQVLLDLSWVVINWDGFVISAAAYKDGNEIAATNVTVSLSRQTLGIELDAAGIVMHASTQAVLPLTGDLDGLTWTLERLSQTDGAAAYAASDDLSVSMETTQDGTAQLVIYNENTQAPAGTYRLTLQRVYDGVVLSSFEIPIFVCY